MIKYYYPLIKALKYLFENSIIEHETERQLFSGLSDIRMISGMLYNCSLRFMAFHLWKQKYHGID